LLDEYDPSSIVSVNTEPFGKDLRVQSEFNKARKARQKEEKKFATYENLVQEHPRKWMYGWHSLNVYKMNYFLFPRTQKLCRGKKVQKIVTQFLNNNLQQL